MEFPHFSTPSQGKITAFWGSFALSAVAISFFLQTAKFTITSALLFAILLLVQIASLTFVAIIRSSKMLVLIPLLLPIFIGIVLFGQPLLFFFLWSFPAVTLFLKLQSVMNNRIRLKFGDDVRGAVTLFFVLLLFSFSFLIPFLNPDMGGEIQTSLKKQLLESGNIYTEKIQESLLSQAEKEIQQQLLLCNGDSVCLQNTKEQLDILKKNAGEKNGRNSIETFLSPENTKSIFANNEAFSAFSENGVSSEKLMKFAIGVVLFLLLVPFAFPLSFLYTFALSILFSLLSIAGVFCIRKENVQREIIV